MLLCWFWFRVCKPMIKKYYDIFEWKEDNLDWQCSCPNFFIQEKCLVPLQLLAKDLKNICFLKYRKNGAMCFKKLAVNVFLGHTRASKKQPWTSPLRKWVILECFDAKTTKNVVLVSRNKIVFFQFLH